VPEIVSKVINGLHDRLDKLRYRGRAQGRFRRADEGIAIVLVLGFILGLGALAAVVVTRSDSATVYIARSNALQAASSTRPDAGTNVITEIVKRGETTTVRVVRRRVASGGVVTRTVVGAPSATIYQTQTVTTRDVATVTEVQQVTVTAPAETITVFETVTCKPKGC
jgi:hypothetical protein